MLITDFALETDFSDIVIKSDIVLPIRPLYLSGNVNCIVVLSNLQCKKIESSKHVGVLVTELYMLVIVKKNKFKSSLRCAVFCVRDQFTSFKM